MDCHQILSGACNVGDKCFAIGSVEGINFTVSITHHSVDLFLGTKKFFINAHQICWLVASKDEMNKHSFLMLVFFFISFVLSQSHRKLFFCSYSFEHFPVHFFKHFATIYAMNSRHTHTPATNYDYTWIFCMTLYK